MSLSHVFIITTIVGIAVIAGRMPLAAEPEVIFHDNFDRADADTVGNQWSIKGKIILKDNAALFRANEEEFRPRMKHSFPLQTEGRFTASFQMDWLREAEGTWGFFMQLGNSSEIPRFLIREPDLAKGIAVNLLWGGGEQVDSQASGSFGYCKDGEFKSLLVTNDAKVKDSVVDHSIVTIQVDIDAATYRLTYNGKTFSDLPFENKIPIDTIRFMANGVSSTGFAKSSIDDVMIKKTQ